MMFRVSNGFIEKAFVDDLINSVFVLHSSFEFSIQQTKIEQFLSLETVLEANINNSISPLIFKTNIP